MIKEISGKNQSIPKKHQEVNNYKVTSKKEIAKLFADIFSEKLHSQWKQRILNMKKEDENTNSIFHQIIQNIKTSPSFL